MGAEAEGEGEGDGEENNLSLSAMEAALKPQVLETFEKIAATYEKLHKIQELPPDRHPARRGDRQDRQEVRQDPRPR